MSQQNLLDEWDELIKQGQGHLVRKKILSLKSRQIERELRARLANLMRRVGLNQEALKLLNPLVRRQEKEKEGKATAEEVLEYAMNLIHVGAFREGRELLTSLNGNQYPEAILFQAFAHIRQWDYYQAQSQLILYLQSSRISPYQRLIGQINLAGSYVALIEKEKALEVIEEIMRSSKSEHPLIYGFCLELKAQLYILTENESRGYLRQAAERLSQTSSRYHLWVEKWEAFEMAYQGDKSAIDEVKKVRERAQESMDFETIRECDSLLARITNNIDLFYNVYYGTPYPAYREKILRSYTEKNGCMALLEFGRYQFEPSDKMKHLNLVTAKDLDIPPGKGLHQLLTVLTRDFYHPVRVAAIFSELYEDLYFNPYSSHATIHSQISRLKIKLKPYLEVKHQSGGYLLDSCHSLELILAEKILSTDEIYSLTIKDLGLSDCCDSQIIADILGISRRGAQSYLKKCKSS